MQYPVELEFEYQQRQSRLTTFFRGILAIPHIIIMEALSVAAAAILFVAWWAILFTGRYPRTFHDFTAWFLRWNTRVTAYLYLMTDRYPPFSGEPSTIAPPPPPPPQQP